MTMKWMEAMEYMDQKYIDEAVEPKRASYRPVLRWGAVAACFVLVVALFAGFLGHLPARQTEIVLPPTRFGATSSAGCLAASYTLAEGVAEADAVAWIRIGNWLGEETEDHPIGKTYFTAEVVNCYKGELPETFVLKQYGSTKGTDKAFPLLTYGNEMLLLLNKAENAAFENCYNILGGYGTVMDVVKNEDGAVFVSDRIGYIGEHMEESMINYSARQNPDTEIAVFSVDDEVQSGFVHGSDYVFALEDIEDILRG